MKRSFIAYAVALVALSASLAGCNGGGDPTPSPTVTSSSSSASPSASASPSSSPSPSVSIPAEAMQQTPEGAVAFVKFYVDQINLAWTTPTAAVLPPLQTSSCNSCAGFQGDAEAYVLAGTRMVSAPASVEKVIPRDGAAPGAQFVQATITESVVDIVDRAGAVVDRSSAMTGTYVFAVVWGEGQWRVNGVVKE